MPQVLGVVAERDGAVLLTEAADGGLALPALELGAGDGVDALTAHLASLSGLPVQPGLVYSIYEDTRARRQHVIYRATLGEGAATGGVFFPVEALPLERIADAATRDVLKRYAAEKSLGNFGVYVGNQERGRVHAQPVRS